MCEHHDMGVHHNIFVNGHSSLKDCDVAALPIPDMIDGSQALWIGSSGLLCLACYPTRGISPWSPCHGLDGCSGSCN